MIVIVDYGVGNSRSIKNMFKRIGADSVITQDVAVIEQAQKLLLPGVGAFDPAMQAIHERGLHGVLQHKVMAEKVPVLGICLGMQLLGLGSEEGELPGLGWIDMRARKFPAMEGLKVPHMGWNRVFPTGHGNLHSPDVEPRFYFVHSYCVKTEDRSHAVMTAKHGIEFDAVVQCGNVYGAQFHPEKSHRFGMGLLESFMRL